MNLGAPELLIILVVVLLIFGGSRLPKLARSLGKAQQEFKRGVEEGADEDEDDEPAVEKSSKSSKSSKKTRENGSDEG